MLRLLLCSAATAVGGMASPSTGRPSLQHFPNPSPVCSDEVQARQQENQGNENVLPVKHTDLLSKPKQPPTLVGNQ